MEIEGAGGNRRGRWKSKGYVEIEGVRGNRRGRWKSKGYVDEHQGLFESVQTISTKT